MNINEIETLIEDNSNNINDVSLDFDLSEVELDSFDYSYGSINSIELSGTPIIGDDLLVIDKDRLVEAFNDALEGSTNSVWQDSEDTLQVIQEAVSAALVEHLTGRVVTGVTERGLVSWPHQQLISNIVLSVRDRINLSK